ncbi:MAG: cytidine deaminase, partial [Clostridia bacterium]|nr:cytidine deaminase [Clostridia bacterium]
TLYMCCTDPATGDIVGGTTSCMMCKRLVINAGIEKVYVRETKDKYSVYNVSEWIENDDSLDGSLGY